MQHATVYRRTGRYAAWPANYGMWSWGNEIYVVFTVGYHYSQGGFHSRDKTRPFELIGARSYDGGETWTTEPVPMGMPRAVEDPSSERPPTHTTTAETGATETATPSDRNGFVTLETPIDFDSPDLAVMCARDSGIKGARSWFYVSEDRCKSWKGPFPFPNFGLQGVAARTDYVVLGRHEALFFLTGAKSDGEEGFVFCAHTVDGGRTFDFKSAIGPEPDGFAIMPASVRLDDGAILTAVRMRSRPNVDGTAANWIDLYRSDDDGIEWHPAGTPAPDTGTGGNPAAMLQLADGRLCIIYGFRDAPHGIRMRLSDDFGVTWGDETYVRRDGGNHDIGYPRAVQRPDGKVVVVYYYNDRPDTERYIASTVFQV